MNTMYSYGVIFCIPPAGHPSNLAGAVHKGTLVFLCGVGLGTCAHGREVRLQRLSMSSVILADTVVQEVGNRELVKGKTNAPGTCAWGVCGESGIISLPGPSRRTRRGGMTDYRAARVSFFTAWACGPLGPWVTVNSTSSPSLSDLKPDASIAE